MRRTSVTPFAMKLTILIMLYPMVMPEMTFRRLSFHLDNDVFLCL
ncbi:hypothetical protein OAT16_05130 [Prolixibacteraceae bacterium]|nr:hypothetical protein [Prolixibacteraceae bacterium]